MDQTDDPTSLVDPQIMARYKAMSADSTPSPDLQSMISGNGPDLATIMGQKNLPINPSSQGGAGSSPPAYSPPNPYATDTTTNSLMNQQAMQNPQVQQMLLSLAGQTKPVGGTGMVPDQGLAASMGNNPILGGVSSGGTDPYAAMMTPPPMTPPPAPIY